MTREQAVERAVSVWHVSNYDKESIVNAIADELLDVDNETKIMTAEDLAVVVRNCKDESGVSAADLIRKWASF